MLVFLYPSVRYLGERNFFFLYDVEKLNLTLALAFAYIYPLKIIILHTEIYDKKMFFCRLISHTHKKNHIYTWMV